MQMYEQAFRKHCLNNIFFILQEHFAINHASKDLGPEFVAFYKNLMLVSEHTHTT